MADHDWTAAAACAGMNPDLFLVSNRGVVSTLARRTCRGCEVKAECLADGWDDDHMLRGGLTPRERVVLRRRGLRPASTGAR